MKDRILSGVFSVSGISMILAVAGFLSALVTMFIDVASPVPIRTLLMTVLVLVSIIVILLKVIHDLASAKAPAAPFEHPIKLIAEERIFVIRRNENFLNNIIVGCYSHQDDVDRLAYIAVVHLVQDKVIQIKVHTDLGLLKKLPTTADQLKALVIRPVVPVTALQQYQTSENAI